MCDIKPLEETDPELAGLIMKVCRKEIKAVVNDTKVYERTLLGFREVTLEAGRNDPCPCGSGKKFKKCCGRSI